jgi:hypothetical protein
MSDDPAFERLKREVQPELDKLQADHERTMRLIAQMPEPSAADKRAIAEMASPEGWQRAIREVINQSEPDRPRKFWLIVAAVVFIAATIVCTVALTRYLS